MAEQTNKERIEPTQHTEAEKRIHLSESRRRPEVEPSRRWDSHHNDQEISRQRNPSRKRSPSRSRHESRELSDGRSKAKLTVQEELTQLKKRLDDQDKLITELKKGATSQAQVDNNGHQAQMETVRNEQANNGQGGESSDHPFSEAIMAFPMPENLKAPSSVDFYLGNTDPQEHLDTFLVAMTCQGARDAYKCRTFPLTLKKAALRWYSRLEPNSVTCWKDMAAKFLGHFTTSKVQPKSEHYLSQVKQENDESLRDFLTRFNSEYLSITDIEPSVALHLLRMALRPGEFTDHLVMHKVKNMDEVMKCAEKYINLEEYQKAQDNLEE